MCLSRGRCWDEDVGDERDQGFDRPEAHLGSGGDVLGTADEQLAARINELAKLDHEGALRRERRFARLGGPTPHRPYFHGARLYRPSSPGVRKKHGEFE